MIMTTTMMMMIIIMMIIIMMIIIILMIMIIIIIMTQPFYECRLHWVPDPSPATPHRLDDLTSPVAVATDPTSPAEAHPRLPGREKEEEECHSIDQ